MMHVKAVEDIELGMKLYHGGNKYIVWRVLYDGMYDYILWDDINKTTIFADKAYKSRDSNGKACQPYYRLVKDGEYIGNMSIFNQIIKE